MMKAKNSFVFTENFRIFFLSLVSAAMAAFLPFHFCCIWLFGRLYVAEPNSVILVMETLGIIGIFCFSAYCVLKQFGR